VIHDRLPFFDLPESAVGLQDVDAALIKRTRRGQQVRRVVTRVVERLDL
jgi:hypothetical protein